MASLKDVKIKIGGVKKTKQITKAMNMVASAKLRGAQQKIEKFRPFADKFQAVLEDLSDKADGLSHPLLQRRQNVSSVAIILITSDRGLCGSFNITLITEALQLAKKCQSDGVLVKFYCIGKKGIDAVRKAGFEISEEYAGQMVNIDFQLAGKICYPVLQKFLSGDIDEVHLVYGQFISVAKQTAMNMQLLPLAQIKTEKIQSEKASAGYSYEPSVESLLANLLPRSVNIQVYRGLLDTSASEHAARMTAMDNATRNCDEIASALTLLYNKTRQAAITTDLMDIVAGAEALNG